MENKVIKIKCPCCGAILEVKTQPGIENKSVTCPVCKEKQPFKAYKIIVEAAPEETEYPHGDGAHKEETEIGSGQNFTLGELKVADSTLPPFRLKVGKNVIGRKSPSSSADFQIPTSGEKRMSREHLVVEVKKVPGKGFTHCVSLYKEKVNATWINGIRLEYGDCVVLKDGDQLRLPEATLVFEIPDEEKTEV